MGRCIDETLLMPQIVLEGKGFIVQEPEGDGDVYDGVVCITPHTIAGKCCCVGATASSTLAGNGFKEMVLDRVPSGAY